MARGKYARHTVSQRCRQAEERVAALETMLRYEKRTREMAQERARRADQLEVALGRMQTDLELRTSDEVRRLEHLVGELQAQRDDARQKQAHIQKAWDKFIVNVRDRLVGDAGFTAPTGFVEWLFEMIDGREITISEGVHGPMAKNADAVRHIQMARGQR